MALNWSGLRSCSSVLKIIHSNPRVYHHELTYRPIPQRPDWGVRVGWKSTADEDWRGKREVVFKGVSLCLSLCVLGSYSYAVIFVVVHLVPEYDHPQLNPWSKCFVAEHNGACMKFNYPSCGSIMAHWILKTTQQRQDNWLTVWLGAYLAYISSLPSAIWV